MTFLSVYKAQTNKFDIFQKYTYIVYLFILLKFQDSFNFEMRKNKTIIPFYVKCNILKTRHLKL